MKVVGQFEAGGKAKAGHPLTTRIVLNELRADGQSGKRVGGSRGLALSAKRRISTERVSSVRFRGQARPWSLA